jgi:hypothetical protein
MLKIRKGTMCMIPCDSRCFRGTKRGRWLFDVSAVLSATGMARGGRLAGVLLTFCLILGGPSVSGSAGEQALTWQSFLTNCPPIKSLVLEAQYYSPRATMLQFRYQPGAFYAYQMTQADPSGIYYATSRGTSCGYWGDEFWYLEPAGPRRPPVFTTGIDTGPVKMLGKNRMFEDIFSFFTSLGISPEGVNSVRVEGNKVTALMNPGDPKQELTQITTLVLSNGLPVSGLIEQESKSLVKPKPYSLSYHYDAASVPLPIPKEILMTLLVPPPGMPETADTEVYGVEKTLLHLIVKEIELGTHSDLLPRKMFTPDAKQMGSNYFHVVITNGQNFQLRGTNLISMAVPQEQLDRELVRGRRRINPWTSIFFITIAFLLPTLIIVRRWNREKDKANK